MPYAVHGSEEGFFKFSVADTPDEAIAKFNATVAARRALVHPMSTITVREVTVKWTKPRQLEDRLVATILRAHRRGAVERLPGKPTVEYKAPKRAGDKCVDCGRAKSYGAGLRCRECYSARAGKNALWKAKT